jgi:hypothetical protein
MNRQRSAELTGAQGGEESCREGDDEGMIRPKSQ